MTFMERFNARIHPFMRQYLFWRYRRLIKFIRHGQPQFFKPLSQETIAKHKRIWRKLGYSVDTRWITYNCNVAGEEDYRCVPSGQFFGVVERIFNECDHVGYGLDDKNELWRYVPAGCEPKVFLRYIRGSFYDADLNWMTIENAERLLASATRDLVGKGCRSCGGKAVRLYKWNGSGHVNGKVSLSAAWIARNGGESFVVQEKINQCDFTASFNPGSINTCRLMTMRCPWNGEIVPLKMVMRMGVTDSLIDNLSSGGVCVSIGPDGRFANRAYDDYGKPFDVHPTSGKSFGGAVHPYYKAMVQTALDAHKKMPYSNLLSFDMVPRKDGSICIVEINTRSQGIDMMEHDFGPLFGDYTEKVIQWCLEHKELDTFEHLRTWY